MNSQREARETEREARRLQQDADKQNKAVMIDGDCARCRRYKYCGTPCRASLTYAWRIYRKFLEEVDSGRITVPRDGMAAGAAPKETQDNG